MANKKTNPKAPLKKVETTDQTSKTVDGSVIDTKIAQANEELKLRSTQIEEQQKILKQAQDNLAALSNRQHELNIMIASWNDLLK